MLNKQDVSVLPKSLCKCQTYFKLMITDQPSVSYYP